MEKKSKLLEASAAVATTTTESVTTRTTTTTTAAPTDAQAANPFYWIWRGIVWIFRTIFVTIPVSIWKWLRSLDVAAVTNMALLLLIIVMFCILLGHFWHVRHAGDNVRVTNGDYVATTDNADTATQPVVTPAAQRPTKVSVRVPAKVTFDKTADNLIITLPLKKTVAPAVESGIIETSPSAKATGDKPTASTETPEMPAKRPLIANVETVGDEIVDITRFGGPRLVSNSVVHGNLYVQNAHFYTLPCNITIEGDLYIRNVGLLRFCGDFNIQGNIVVSANSSFGPIPPTARLGGQVIF
ncbi:MAG: hypothetical protein FWC51_03810 [Proteobacteria bacterium]|nr:hypothetical protein [Pseudomonadota bacterium]